MVGTNYVLQFHQIELLEWLLGMQYLAFDALSLHQAMLLQWLVLSLVPQGRLCELVNTNLLRKTVQLVDVSEILVNTFPRVRTYTSIYVQYVSVLKSQKMLMKR
jgi:hypothetical protein